MNSVWIRFEYSGSRRECNDGAGWMYALIQFCYSIFLQSVLIFSLFNNANLRVINVIILEILKLTSFLHQSHSALQCYAIKGQVHQ